jgi:hypothetical protein
MTLRRLALSAALVAVASTPGTAGAQTVVGRVLDQLTAAPIPTAALMLLDSADVAVARAESDSMGRFVLRAPRTGVYRIHAERMAYEEMFSEDLPLRDEGSVELLVRMAPLPVELDSLVVTADWQSTKLERSGFYRRQMRSTGYFFDVEEIEKWHPTHVTDLLRRVPGVTIRHSRISGGAVAVSARRNGRCTMKVVLDGFKVNVTDDTLDWFVRPEHTIGIEVYPNGVGAPVEHRGTDAPCGIIMLWTR